MQNSMSKNVKKFYKTSIQQIPTDQTFLGKYQKHLSKKRVADIVAGFNPNRMRPIEQLRSAIPLL
jgi:hypothetical protein